VRCGVGHRRGRPDGSRCSSFMARALRVRVDGRWRRRTRKSIRRAAGEALALRGAIQELGCRGLRRPCADSARAGARCSSARRPGCAGGPRWRRGPVPRRVPSNGGIPRIGRGLDVALVVDLGSGGGGDGARGGLGSISRTSCVRGLAAGPILERRADREGAREAVRLLVRDGPRRGWGFGEAAVSVVRARRPSIAIVAERDERTGRGTVHAGQPSLRHPGDDTRPVGLERALRTRPLPFEPA